MADLKSQTGLIIIISLILLSLGIGVLIGYLVTPTARVTDIRIQEAIEEDKWEKEKDVIKKIIRRIDPQRIKKNLKYLTEKPHLAGSERDVELAWYIHNKTIEAGFDSHQMIPYNMLLTLPDPKNPNKVSLFENGAKIFESQHKEKPIHAHDDDPDFVHAFHAYTPAGTVSTNPGEGVVYANYGRLEDLDKLKELGVNISGHIALVRYGKIFRGNKVIHAENAGATGILIYSDPQEVAPDGTDENNVYDNSWWLPGTGIQRGTTMVGNGDPLTPGWPSTAHAYKIEESDASFHKIPSQPIGYDDAKVILKLLYGTDSPSDWHGGLRGIDYKLGPVFKLKFKNVSLMLSTHNSNSVVKNFNVISMIKGTIEPDWYVLLGNHRDAWGYGAVDPSSGTAQLLETIRVYGTLLKEGWKPRRSIVFCSWAAEEYGLLGSQEWVEENVDKLKARAVAYINTDSCASGPKVEIKASPLLWNIFHKITSMIPGTHDPTKTVFQEGKNYHEIIVPAAPEKPVIRTLGSGSDFAPFALLGGIPSASITFSKDKVKYNSSSYPFYHTGYETFHMVSTFVDPEFKFHQGCGRIASLAIKYLADSSIIPYSISRYPEVMKQLLTKNVNREKLMTIYDKYSELENAVTRFLETSQKFQTKVKVGPFKPLELRMVNDQLMKLEQSFLIPEGLPGRPLEKHAIFAPSQFNIYASAGFPGLTDLLHTYDTLRENEKLKRDKDIRRHISDLTIMVDRASSLLQEFHLF